MQVLAALLIADAGAYFRHRLFHKSSLLWRFHRIHHSMTELYWIRSAYTHPLEQLVHPDGDHAADRVPRGG